MLSATSFRERAHEDNCLTYSADHVLATNGAKQCITQAVLVVFSRGDEMQGKGEGSLLLLPFYKISFQATGLINCLPATALRTSCRRSLRPPGATEPRLSVHLQPGSSLLYFFDLDTVILILDVLYCDRNYARFFVLETIARVSYFAYRSSRIFLRILICRSHIPLH